MIKARARYGQTLADMAIQTKGSIEALVDIAIINGMSVTDVFSSSLEILVPDKVYDKIMQKYVVAHEVSPATGREDLSVKLRIFTKQFTKEFA